VLYLYQQTRYNNLHDLKLQTWCIIDHQFSLGFKGKPVHTGLYLVRKGMRLDGATLSLF
jgi:hypothetical protein